MKPPIPTAVTLKMHPSFSSSLLNPPKSQGLLSGVTFQDQTLVSSSASRRGWRGRKPGWTLLLQCPVILYLPSVPLCSSDHADRRVVCNYSYWQKWEGTDARTSNLIAQSEHFALIIGPWRVGRVESKRGATSTSESVSYCIATIAVTSLLHLKSLTTALLSNFNLEKEMATHSSILARRIPGWGSLVDCHLWGRTSQIRLT